MFSEKLEGPDKWEVIILVLWNFRKITRYISAPTVTIIN